MSDAAEDKMAVQYSRFAAELPALLSAYRGRWVVYLDGVQQVCSDDQTALRWALEHYARDAGFLIAPIEPPQAVHVSAASALRLGAP